MGPAPGLGPIRGRSGAKAVVEGGGWDAAEGEGFVVAE